MLSWTIIDAEGDVLYPSFLTNDDQHPVDAGWAVEPGQEFIPSDIVPVPGKHVWTGQEWQVGLEEERKRLWERVKELRDASEIVASTSFGKVQSDLKSKVNINGLMAMAQLSLAANVAFSEPFTLADNTVRVFTAQEMLSMARQVGAHVASAYARGRALREQIYADGATVEELSAIDLEAGWP